MSISSMNTAEFFEMLRENPLSIQFSIENIRSNQAQEMEQQAVSIKIQEELPCS